MTICAAQRECLFGEMVAGEMVLNDIGSVVAEEWLRTPEIRWEIELDVWVVMPNHLHGIVMILDIDGSRGTARRAPALEQFGNPVAGSLPTIVRSFKSAATKRVNILRGTPGAPLWQRNYYEHVIRDEDDLRRIREYIANNPASWLEDENHPARLV